MLKIIIIGLLLSMTACGRKKHIRALDGRLSELEIKNGQLNDAILNHELRLAALEKVSHLKESDVRAIFQSDLDSLNQQVLVHEGDLTEINLELARLESLINATNDALSALEILSQSEVVALFETRFSTLEQSLIDQSLTVVQINQALSDLSQDVEQLETRLDQNDLFTDMPTCNHSYAALYDGNGNIKTVYITENNGTVAGSWELNNNSVYNLLIDGQTTCTNVRYRKNEKTLEFTDFNGLAQVIDLSY